MLSDSESEGEGVQQLTINEHFAKAYARKKEREELDRLKEKYGSGAEEESEDSEDTDEDEEGEELTPAVDAAILRTLARIKRKDPGIYDADKDVFEEEQMKTKGSFAFGVREKDKSKPLLMRQHFLNSTLKPSSRSPSPSHAEPTHVEEQAALRQETISAFHTAVVSGSGSEEEDEILVPREKTKDERERELEEYRAFLTREVGEDIGGLVTIEEGVGARVEENEEDEEERNVAEAEAEGNEEEKGDKKRKKKKKKKGKGKKSKEEADHEFLMNYILNRGWIDQSTRHVPTFDEVTGQGSRGSKASKEKGESESRRVEILGGGEDAEVPEDFDEEEFDDVVETFESSYNFRYEEPDAATIPAHPREIASTVRREENPRKAARERKKERKEEEILKKREEVKRMKALKMKEIKEKLAKIGKEGGKSADDEALAQLDLEGDWDPEAHDRQMEGIYGGEEDGAEYGDSEGWEAGDLEKPTWDDDIDIGDIMPTEPEAGPSSSKKKKDKKDKKKKNAAAEDEDGVDVAMMDADYIGEDDPDRRKELDEAMDDVYGLEFNDIVGGLPTRFKYTPVLPQAYGLSSTEILLADDADLNNVVGLRALAPYRRDRGRAWDASRGERLKEFRKEFSQKRGFVNGSGGAGLEGGRGEDGGAVPKKRKGKKERQKAKLGVTEAVDVKACVDADSQGGNEKNKEGDRVEGGEPPAKKKKRRHKKSTQVEDS